jgi:acyl-CoA synthetase (AMP-forming)/AMP-acid ligase II
MAGTTWVWEPPAGADVLFAPGAPFEIATEPVLGVDCKVFKNRLGNIREVLTAFTTRHGDIPNLVFPEITLTFNDVQASTARVAAWFAERGVVKGDRVAFASANVASYVIGWWATLASGAIVSSLNGWWTPAELLHGIELSKPRLVFADGPRMKRLLEAGLPEDVEVHDLSELDHLLGPARADDPSLPTATIDEDDPAVLLFTSGTTGRPKAACLSHRNFVHFPSAARLAGAVGAVLAPQPAPAAGAPAPKQPSSIMVGPLFHVSGVVPLITGHYTGSKLVFPPVGSWSETTHLELTQEHSVGGWSAVPTQFWRLLEHPDFDKYDTSSVTVVGGGGATYSPELLRLMAKKLPQARLGVGYGMSETLGSGSRLGGVAMDEWPSSVGTVESMCELEIRDEDNNVVDDGEVGEICIRGAVVFLGYWDNPEASAKALDDRRWYRTGDYGRIADGVLYLESRMRDMIIRGGENIYPIEIEHRLEEHPEVAEAAVVGVPHHQLGQEVAVVIVLKPGSALDADGVKTWVSAELARYKVPTHVIFRDALPYNATGKVLKHELEADITAELAAG